MAWVIQRISVLLIIASMFTPSAIAAQCEPYKGIWASDDKNGRWILYFDDVVTTPQLNVYFEHWRGKALDFKMYGYHTCSNGAATCYITILDRHYPYTGNYINMQDGDIGVTAILEHVGNSKSGPAEWMVLGGLNQMLYNSPRSPLKKYSGDSVLPNQYKFLACRKGLIELAVPNE